MYFILSSPLISFDSFCLFFWYLSLFVYLFMQNIGINLFIGQWDSVTTSTLNTLKAAKMPVMCDPNTAARAYPAGEWWGPTQVMGESERE